MSCSTQIAAGLRTAWGGTQGRGVDLTAAPTILLQRPPGREVLLCHRHRAAVTGSSIPGSCKGALAQEHRAAAGLAGSQRHGVGGWCHWGAQPSPWCGSRLLVMQGHPQKKAGEHQPCCSSLAAGRCSSSAEQKAITVFSQRFESSVALLGEGGGKRSQVSSRGMGGCSCSCPRGKSLLCFINACDTT